jgi:hypothetical protein
MAQQIVETHIRKRGLFGWIIVSLFWIFNAYMAVCFLFDVAAPRTAFGHTVVGAALLFVWVAGAVILGLFALLTRGPTVVVRSTT